MALPCAVTIFLLLSLTQGLVPREDTTDIQNEVRTYQAFVDHLFNLTMVRRKSMLYKNLAHFVDEIGNRPAGSDSLERGYEYFIRNITNEFGLRWNVTTKRGDNRHSRYDGGTPEVTMYKEPVTFRPWSRNEEYAHVVKPRKQKLRILGLGFSVPTPEAGIEAPVLIVRSFQELRRLRKLVPGRIVVFNQEYENYRHTVQYRLHGASQAAQYGAVAVLVRSVTPASLQTPHTGSLRYQDGIARIPAAAITIEDAHMLTRMFERNPNDTTVKLYMSCQTLEPVESGNLVLEIAGKTNRDEVVLLGGHLDSWDVGLGVMDNAAGAMISLEAMKLIYRYARGNPRFPERGRYGLDTFPRRTVRMVIWTAEEIGYHGAKVHYENNKAYLSNISMVMEMDTGTFTPTGIVFTGEPRSVRIMTEIAKLFSSIGATNLRLGKVGGDTADFRKAHVPAAALDFSDADYNRYFRYHHTEADTMAAVDAAELDMCTAMWTAMAAVVADLSEPLI